MPFIGNQPSNNFVSLNRQDITGDGGATYTLDHKVASVNDVLIYVNHVKQDPSSYSISGTSLTMGGNVASTDDFYIIYLGQALQTVTPKDNTITTAMLQDDAVTDAKINASLGKVLQVVQTTKTTSFTTNSTSWTDITGYSATITPSATSSKILVLGNYSIAADTASAGGLCYFKILRGSTDLLESTDSGTYEHAYHEIEANTTYGHVNFGRFNLLVLDSPSTTSATTYKCQMRMNATSNTNVFGRSGRSDTNTSDARGATELILMEIGA